MKSCGLVVKVLLLAGLCGCASHLATVKTKPARLPAGLRVEESLEPATRYLSVAEHEQPFAALGHDLLATKISYGVNSIMGDRGRGDTPNSSDGVVPYWSPHLEEAQSELIVNPDHGAQYNPQAIREVARILKTNLGHSNE